MGEVHGGIIQAIDDILPKNTIKVPDSIFINYDITDSNRARIENGRVIGYFNGEVMGLDENQQIKDPNFGGVGDLDVENTDAPFKY